MNCLGTDVLDNHIFFLRHLGTLLRNGKYLLKLLPDRYTLVSDHEKPWVSNVEKTKSCSCSSENINQCLDPGRYEGFNFWGTFPGGQNPPGFSQQHRSKISPVSWIFFKPVQFKWHSNFSLIQVILQATILFVNLFPFEILN